MAGGRGLSGLALLVCGLVTTSAPGVAARTEVPTLTVRTEIEGPEVSGRILGVNHRYAFDGYGMWDQVAAAPDPAFVDAFESAGFGALRFPGGLLANQYHWTRAIGPVSERGYNVAGLNGAPVENDFGPDEFGSFIEEHGIEGTIVVNASTNDSDYAADWVEYMNTPAGEGNPRGGVDWAEVRAANGHTDPYGIKFWEVGNEPWHPKQKYWLDDFKYRQLATHYAFGGTTRFQLQPVATHHDYRQASGYSTEERDQVVTVRFPPIDERVNIFVGSQRWHEVADLALAGPEPVYEVDRSTGEVRFGDGEHGLVPPQGELVRATYDSGPHDGYVDFYKKMKKVDPSIRVGSSLAKTEFMVTMGTRPYDFVVLHLRGGKITGPSTPAEAHDILMAAPAKLGEKVQRVRTLIEEHSGRDARRAVAITEWAPHRSVAEVQPRYLLSLDSALYSALQLKEWIELDVPLAQRHTLIDFEPATDLPSFGDPDEAIIGPAPHFVPSATIGVFSLFSKLAGSHVVHAEVVPADTSPVEVLAAMDEEHLRLIVINTDAEADAEVALSLPADPGAELVVSEVNGAELGSYNAVAHPDAISLTRAVEPAGPNFSYRFPAHSVTLLEIALSAQS